MRTDSFRPVDILRHIEADYGQLAETFGATFEAFGSLGCDKPREGCAEKVEGLLRQVLGPSPFGSADDSIRLKVSAKTDKPVVVEVLSSNNGLVAGPEIAAAVAELGGSIAASGGSVRITLPLKESLIVDEELPLQPREETAVLVGSRILIADDSATNRLVLEEMLADTKAVLVSVNDGKEALDSWRTGKFDLLLLDISMPVMDGVTAIRKIREAEQELGLPPTPAIAVTANALVNQVADYLVAGFDTHLAKPFRRKDLMHAILTLRK